MAITDRRACPIIIAGDNSSVSLERIPLTGRDSKGTYDERWLQDLLYRHPNVLPVEEIDNSYSGLIPICTELSTAGTGYRWRWNTRRCWRNHRIPRRSWQTTFHLRSG